MSLDAYTANIALLSVNKKSSNSIPSEIKLEDSSKSNWNLLYGYSVLIKILGGKAYLIVPVHSKTVKCEILEVGQIP